MVAYDEWFVIAQSGGGAYSWGTPNPITIFSHTVDFSQYGIERSVIDALVTFSDKRLSMNDAQVVVLLGTTEIFRAWSSYQGRKERSVPLIVSNGQKIQIKLDWKECCSSQISVLDIVVQGIVRLEHEPDYSGPCEFFGFLGDKMSSVSEFVEDIGDWFEPMWLVGNEIKALFYYLAAPFRYARDYLYELQTWCVNVSGSAASILTITGILELVSETFAIVLETADSIVSSAKEAVLGTFATLDEWYEAQKSKTISWVSEQFENILDEVFK
jgi:hypothetical protein